MTCLGEVVKHLPHAVGYMFVKETFSQDAKNDVKNMVDNLKIAFENNLATLGPFFIDGSELDGATFKLKRFGIFFRYAFGPTYKNRTQEWMDEISKNAALRKLRSMRFKIGYPNYYDDNITRFDELHNFQVDKSDYYNNVERSVKSKDAVFLLSDLYKIAAKGYFLTSKKYSRNFILRPFRN
mgnify:CR=1 FL=1